MSVLNILKWRFNPHPNPTTSFEGKTVLVTGGSCGIGLEAAVKYLELGAASVTIGARNIEKANGAKAEIEQRAQRPGGVQIWPLDMNSYKSVIAFAERASKELPRLDVALMNAGLMQREYRESEDGWEEILQVNALSMALLALLLLPQLKASRTETNIPHLVFTTSTLFKGCTAKDLTPPDGRGILEYHNDKDNFDGRLHYKVSKLLVEFTRRHLSELAKGPDGSIQVVVSSVCPGLCTSNLGRCFDRSYEVYLGAVFFAIFAYPTEVGGRTLVSATCHGVESHDKVRMEDHYPEYVFPFCPIFS